MGRKKGRMEAQGRKEEGSSEESEREEETGRKCNVTLVEVRGLC